MYLEAVFNDVHPIGFEPMTYGLENRCSIQLSYGCVFPCWSAKDRIYAQYQQIYFQISVV